MIGIGRIAILNHHDTRRSMNYPWNNLGTNGASYSSFPLKSPPAWICMNPWRDTLFSGHFNDILMFIWFLSRNTELEGKLPRYKINIQWSLLQKKQILDPLEMQKSLFNAKSCHLNLSGKRGNARVCLRRTCRDVPCFLASFRLHKTHPFVARGSFFPDGGIVRHLALSGSTTRCYGRKSAAKWFFESDCREMFRYKIVKRKQWVVIAFRNSSTNDPGFIGLAFGQSWDRNQIVCA